MSGLIQSRTGGPIQSRIGDFIQSENGTPIQSRIGGPSHSLYGGPIQSKILVPIIVFMEVPFKVKSHPDWIKITNPDPPPEIFFDHRLT